MGSWPTARIPHPRQKACLHHGPLYLYVFRTTAEYEVIGGFRRQGTIVITGYNLV